MTSATIVRRVRALALLLSLGLGLAGGAVSAAGLDTRAPHWVSFESARVAPSALAARAAVPGHAAWPSREPAALRGMLVIPKGAGPFPAVVLLHDCRGVLPSQRGWAQWLAGHGYIALLVDSFFTRAAHNVCDLSPDASARPEVGGRVFDAFGALQYLSGLPLVDPDRIAVMGWADWAAVSAVSRSGPMALIEQRFRAALAVTPDCPLASDALSAPVLVLAAENDRRFRSARCRVLAVHHGSMLELEMLPGAEHGFDDIGARHGRYLPAVFDLRRAPDRGLHLRYDPASHRAAAESVLAFLGKHLDTAPGFARHVTRAAARGPHWVVDPAHPGSDLPAQGQSLFDVVFSDGAADGAAHALPFPFPRILDRLEDAIDSARGSRDGLSIVMIPLGRSLQRAAAAPDFFRYPRIVVAVDGESTHRVDRAFLKDRLFLGYHEKAQVIEVISYNEQAARFEFQVVENYAPGRKPVVRYANRALCTSCHQNGAPIFSRAGWDETNANTETARRLGELQRRFYGLSVNTGGSFAALVDNATDRANLLSVWQLLWRVGCGGEPASAGRCRAAALEAMLHYRLAASTGFDKLTPTLREQYLGPVSGRIDERWPQGLAVPNPDIENREPLLEPMPMDIVARVDPLTPRAPLATWNGREAALQLIANLAQSLPDAALTRIDRHLATRATAGDAATTSRGMPCTVLRRSGAFGQGQLRASCQPANAASGSADMHLQLHGNALDHGYVRFLTLPGGGHFERLLIAAGQIESHPDGRRVLRTGVVHREGGRRVRTPDGHAIVTMQLAWQEPRDGRFSDGPVAARIDFDLVHDAGPLHTAIQALARAAGNGQGPLAWPRFEPAPIASALLDALGAGDGYPCCETRALPPALPPQRGRAGRIIPELAQSVGVATNEVQAVLAAFQRRCSACHGGPTLTPPGFLNGDERSVLAALTQCAPRIQLRLEMWALPLAQRLKSPMPPAPALAADGLDAMSWRASEDYLQLAQWARSASVATQILATAADTPGRGSRGYETLPPCLPLAAVLSER